MKPVRRLTTTRRITITAVTLVLITSLASPALADPDSEGRGENKISEEGLEDSRFDASASNQSEGYIRSVIAYQETVNSIVDPIIIKHEEVFSEAGFNDDETAYVAFTSTLPPADAATVRSAPGVELIEDAMHTATAADELMETVAAIVEESLPVETGLYAHVSPLDGDSTISTESKLSESVQDSIRTIIDEGTSSLAPGRSTRDSRLTFKVDETLESHTEAVNGGDTLTVRNTTTQACTAAFPANNGNGQRGLLTAAHCRNDLTVDRGNRLYSASHIRQYRSGDMQFHRSREAVNPRFRHAWSSYRPVSAHPVLKVGTRVCRFGAVSGNGSGCATVGYVSACIYYDNERRTYCKLAMTWSHTGSVGGDSGGPWYYGNNAYGIHSGSGYRDGVFRNYFYPSRMAFVGSTLSAVYG